MVGTVIWSAALDAQCSRSEGRRVPQDLAVPEATVVEIAEVVWQVDYDAVIERDKAYSRPIDRAADLLRGRGVIDALDLA